MNDRHLLWILEDDESTCRAYDSILGLRYELQFFSEISALRTELANSTQAPDLLIAELRLPDETFVHYLGESELAMTNIAYLIVSASDDIDSFRFCYAKGAIDYIKKPFTVNELLAKVERALKREPIQGEKTPLKENALAIESLSLRVDPATLTARRLQLRSLPLTSKEYQIMVLFCQGGGRSLSKQELLVNIWNDAKVSPKTLDVHIVNLRKKIENLGLGIRHIPPFHYSLFDAKQTLDAMAHEPVIKLKKV